MTEHDVDPMIAGTAAEPVVIDAEIAQPELGSGDQQ